MALPVVPATASLADVIKAHNALLKVLYPDTDTPPPPPPPKPTPTSVVGLAAKTTANAATLSWKPPAAPYTVTGYKVGRNGTDSAGKGPWSGTAPANTASFIMTLLKPDTEYSFTVTPVSAKGDGTPTVVKGRTLKTGVTPPPPPPPPTGTGKRPVIVGTANGPLLTVGGNAQARLKLAGICVWGIKDYITTSFGDDQWNARQQVVNTIKAWGSNHVRLRVLGSEYNETGDKAGYIAKVKAWRDLTVAAGMYFYVTGWDSLDGPYSHGNWAGQYQQAFPMWDAIIKALGNDEKVMYEPFNEPCDVDWAPWQDAMTNTITHFRGQGYKNVLIIDTIQWSHGYDDGRMTQLEQHDSRLLGGGHHQLIFCKHDYANEYPGKNWDAQHWINSMGGGGGKHIILESEFGNFNGGQDTINEGWSEAASKWFAGRFNEATNWAGGTSFLFGPWWDENALTDGSNQNPTNWGRITRDSFLGLAKPTMP